MKCTYLPLLFSSKPYAATLLAAAASLRFPCYSLRAHPICTFIATFSHKATNPQNPSNAMLHIIQCHNTRVGGVPFKGNFLTKIAPGRRRINFRVYSCVLSGCNQFLRFYNNTVGRVLFYATQDDGQPYLLRGRPVQTTYCREVHGHLITPVLLF